MPKFVIANSREDFDKAELDDAVHLENPAQLAGIEGAEIIVLPGAEEHPLLSNGRVKAVQAGGAFEPAPVPGSDNAIPKGHVADTGQAVPLDVDVDHDDKVQGDALGEHPIVPGRREGESE